MADPLDPQGAQSTPNTDAASTPSYTIGAPAGLLEPGTIDLNNRPVVSNADGTHSSEYSTSFGDDKGREVLVPTVVKGKFLTPDGKKPAEGSDAEQQMFTRAQKHYEDTHEHLGIFSSADAADKYANTVHLRNEPIVVSAPDGSKVSFPKGTPTPQVNAEMSKWWEGHTQRAAQLWSGVKNYVSNASQAMGGPASIPELDADTKDFLLNPDETLKGAIGGLLKGMNTAVMSLGPGNDENKAMVQRAQQEWHDGNHLAAATTIIPLVGDGLAKAVKQAQAHDFSGSFGTATGVALPFFVGDAGINEGLGDTAAQLRGRYLPKSTLTEAAPVAAPVAATEAPKSEVAHGADAFNAEHGRPPVEHKEVAPSPHAKAIADEYDKLKHDPSDPAVQKSYDAMKSDIDDQWDYATQKMGMTFEPWKGEGQPYKNSKEMAADVKDNKHLYFYQGGDLPADHPLGETDEATGLSYNDKLRAVHDLFGHAANGNQFGPAGEERSVVNLSEKEGISTNEAVNRISEEYIKSGASELTKLVADSPKVRAALDNLATSTGNEQLRPSTLESSPTFQRLLAEHKGQEPTAGGLGKADRAVLRRGVKSAVKARSSLTDAKNAKAEAALDSWKPAGLEQGIPHSESVKATVPISEIRINRRSLEGAQKDSLLGRGSKTKGPIDLFYNTDNGQLLVEDGHHRLGEAINKGQKTIPAKVWSAGYSDTIPNVPDADRAVVGEKPKAAPKAAPKVKAPKDKGTSFNPAEMSSNLNSTLRDRMRASLAEG